MALLQVKQSLGLTTLWLNRFIVGDEVLLRGGAARAARLADYGGVARVMVAMRKGSETSRGRVGYIVGEEARAAL